MRSPGRFACAVRAASVAAAIGAGSVVACLVPAGAEAQVITSFEFSLSNPGARALGLGGAFVALADDATAAFANPAGLVQIAEPELSVETRSWGFHTPYARGGRAFGEPTGLGIDTVSGPIIAEHSSQRLGLAFASWVHPMKRWSFALFQHQLAAFEFELETQGIFVDGPAATTVGRSTIQAGRIDLDIVTRGLAVAWRPTDWLSLGLGISHFDPSSGFDSADYLPDDDTLDAFFARASFLPDRLVQAVEFSWREPAWGLSAGLLWRLSDRWTLGALYRQTPELDLEIDIVAGPAHPAFPAGTKFVDGFRTAWNFPDVYALGLGYRSHDGRWTAAGEWRRVGYSSIIDSLLPQQRDPDEFLEDADELHLGGEYAFFSGTAVLAVRAGAWHDPDHYYGTRSTDPLLRALFVPGEDQLHFAAGAGVAWRRVQADLGIDLSERARTVALSFIYSLGG